MERPFLNLGTFTVSLESVICAPPGKCKRKFPLIFPWSSRPSGSGVLYYLKEERCICFILDFIEVQDIFIQMNIIILDVVDIFLPDPSGCCKLEHSSSSKTSIAPKIRFFDDILKTISTELRFGHN